eukprot:2703642-Alexandrium_andersonii.AAC.1
MSASLVGSEMCIRDRVTAATAPRGCCGSQRLLSPLAPPCVLPPLRRPRWVPSGRGVPPPLAAAAAAVGPPSPRPSAAGAAPPAVSPSLGVPG